MYLVRKHGYVMLMAKLAYAAKLLTRVDLTNGVMRIAKYKERYLRIGKLIFKILKVYLIPSPAPDERGLNDISAVVINGIVEKIKHGWLYKHLFCGGGKLSYR